jgi:predicted nucleic acid-binding protein
VILVDTSIWVEHLRRREPGLEASLSGGRVLMHPFILGEIACGNLRRRAELLSLMRQLPQAPVASEEEVLEFIEHRHLTGRGIGYVDVHLLASSILAADTRLWTQDRRLAVVAAEIGCAFVAH